MGLTVVDKAGLLISRVASGLVRSGRTLVEMEVHCFFSGRNRDAFRQDVISAQGAAAGRFGGMGEGIFVGRTREVSSGLGTRLPLSRLDTGLAVVKARKRHAAMRTFEFARVCFLGMGVAAGSIGSALAFDDKVFDDGLVAPESSPWDVFKFGYSAYKNGHKDQAAEAYRYAAENGQIGATWKLARMYASGDGVARDDYEAFKFYSEIVAQDVEPGSREESYVSDALVALAGYLKTGIPGSPVAANPTAAQEYYMRAAANYRNPSAQYEMGKMFLKGDGGMKASVQQAGRWFQLAAEKGHAGAQATLGNLLFHSGKVVRGLAMMTAALERATPSEQTWIRGMQEEAFSLAGEADRRTAISLAQDILSKPSSTQ